MEDRVAILRPIHNNPRLLSQLHELMEQQLPRSYPFLTWLRLKHKLYLQSPSHRPYCVYCPNGNLENGIVMFAKVDQVILDVNIFFFNNNLKPMKAALQNTELIDWSKVKSCGVPSGRVAWLYLILKKLGYTIAWISTMDTYILPPEAPNHIARIPDHLYCRPLREAEMQNLRLTCFSEYESSESIIRDCLRYNHSIGIYSKIDETLICWILQFDYGQCLINVAEDMSMNQTIQLIALGIATISNLIARSGQYPMCFVEPNDQILKKIIEDQHFMYNCSYNWLHIKKARNENE